MNTRQRKAVERRLTHRSRSVAVVVTLIAVIVVAAWIGTEAVLASLGQRPLLLSPQTVADVLRDQPWIAATVAVVLAVAGVTLIVLAVSPGRQGRRRLADDRAVILVDDAVLAGALSRAAATAAHVPAGNVRTALGRRTAHVQVSPLTGYPVARDVVSATVDDTLSTARATRPVAPRVTIDSRGGVLA